MKEYEFENDEVEEENFILEQEPRKKSKYTKVDYVDKNVFVEKIKEYRMKKKENPNLQIPREIAEYLMMMTKNIATRKNFALYTWKDDMIGDAILRCVTVFDNFNPELSNNPFRLFL